MDPIPHFLLIISKKKDIASAKLTLQPWVDSGYIRLTTVTTLDEYCRILMSQMHIDCVICDIHQEEEFYEKGIRDVMSVPFAELQVSHRVDMGTIVAMCQSEKCILLTGNHCGDMEDHLTERILRHLVSRSRSKNRIVELNVRSADFEGYWDEGSSQLVACAGHEEILSSKTAVDWRKVIQQSHLFPYLSEAALAATETTH